MSEIQTITIFSVGILLAAFFLTNLVIGLGIEDRPNERSNHDRPIPKSGGIGFLVPFVCGLILLRMTDGGAISGTMALSAVQWNAYLAMIGLVFLSALADDLWDLSPLIKIITQFAAALAFVGMIAHARSVSVPGIGIFELHGIGMPLTVVWIVFFMNAYNFMDGINGIAGGAAVIASAFLGLIALDTGAFGIAFCALSLAAAILGFLPHNFPRARIFMGDTGSQSVGFVLSTLAVLGAAHPDAKIPLFVVPLLFLPFLFDVIFTLIKRARTGQRLWRAHREHLYQLAVKLGRTHPQVTGAYYVMFFVCGAAAYAFVQQPGIHLVWGIGMLLAQFLAIAATLYSVTRTRADGDQDAPATVSKRAVDAKIQNID